MQDKKLKEITMKQSYYDALIERLVDAQLQCEQDELDKRQGIKRSTEEYSAHETEFKKLKEEYDELSEVRREGKLYYWKYLLSLIFWYIYALFVWISTTAFIPLLFRDNYRIITFPLVPILGVGISALSGYLIATSTALEGKIQNCHKKLELYRKAQ